ncbi:MAG: DMT family transporter [Verrucomicrobia bacterium]|nr:DMT family transporter [Verrucomicrobiota bacterium]
MLLAQNYNLRKQTLISMFLVLFSSFCFSWGVSLVKLVSPTLPSLMVLFFRSLFAFTFLLPFILRHGMKNLKTTRLPLHLTRVVFITAALFSTYFAYRQLPLATSSAIGFTGPLITSFLAFLFLKETNSPVRWLLIGLGYGGILIMLQGFSFHLGLPILMAFVANLLASGSNILSKKLLTTESSATLLFYATGASMILSGIASIGIWQMPSIVDIYLLMGVALCGLLSNATLVEALKYGRASFVAPFEYTRLIFATTIGYFLFQEIPSLNVLAGACIIAVSTLLLSRMELKERTVKISP